jgi:hypothetical protein
MNIDRTSDMFLSILNRSGKGLHWRFLHEGTEKSTFENFDIISCHFSAKFGSFAQSAFPEILFFA